MSIFKRSRGGNPTSEIASAFEVKKANDIEPTSIPVADPTADLGRYDPDNEGKRRSAMGKVMKGAAILTGTAMAGFGGFAIGESVNMWEEPKGVNENDAVQLYEDRIDACNDAFDSVSVTVTGDVDAAIVDAQEQLVADREACYQEAAGSVIALVSSLSDVQIEDFTVQLDVTAGDN